MIAMKRILFLAVSVIFSILSIAQTYGLVAPVEPTPPVRPKFIPDWVIQTPIASNQTFRYVVESGEGTTERDAENMALARVYQNVANATAQPISSAEINQALQTGSTFEVIEKKMRIPMIKLCTFPFRQNNDTYKVFVLYQVASAGNVTPMFDSYNDCMAHTFYDKQLAHYKKLEDEYKLKLDNYYKELDRYNKEIERRKLQEKARQDSIRLAEYEKEQRRIREENEHKEALHRQKIKDSEREQLGDNAGAFVGSMFVPGLGQMIKGHGTEGAFTLIGELGFFGTGIGTYCVAKNKLKLINTEALDYSTYMQLKKDYNALRITSYTMYAAAGVLYAFNLYRAWCADHRKKGYYHENYAFYPTVIPVDNQSLALGLGVSFNF